MDAGAPAESALDCDGQHRRVAVRGDFGHCALAAKNADEFVHLASSQRTTHILTSDATGGGHLFPGDAGKSADIIPLCQNTRRHDGEPT
jgi:hypothetical protein